MSDSYRKSPIVSRCCYNARSLMWFKKNHSREERRLLREVLRSGNFEAAEVELVPWDEWNCPRDGKQYVSRETREDLPYLMRK